MTQEPPCRHEFVKIFQRKLKGLERRLVVTRAYLPVGFKPGDFGHLGEGSYCFCHTCRARLHPRRTAAEKAAARLALARPPASGNVKIETKESDLEPDIDVEELELQPLDMQDIEAEGVKLTQDTTPAQLSDE